MIKYLDSSNKKNNGKQSILAKLLNGLGEAKIAAIIFIVLFIFNISVNPGRYSGKNLLVTLGLVAPLVIISIASMPPLLSGGGGIDISLGPLMGLINSFIVKKMMMDWGITSPLIIIFSALTIGILAGMINGFLITKIHNQPMVATLGTYLVFIGLGLTILPRPGGTVPLWIKSFSGQLSFLPIVATIVIWYFIKRSSFYINLMGVGGDEKAAFTSGVPVYSIRFIAYVLAGLFTGIGAISLTALLGSADATVGPTYTLIAIASVALGGISMAGGSGNIWGAILGAFDIFLIQNLLTFFNISYYFLKVSYGAVLIFAVVLNSERIRTIFNKT